MISEPLLFSERQNLPERMKMACDGVSIVQIEPIDSYVQDNKNLPKMTTYINYTSKKFEMIRITDNKRSIYGEKGR